MDSLNSVESKNLPDIDIIMPILNSESYLEKSLKSIRKQEYSGNLNVVVIDGGSTDRSREIAEKYGCLVYVHKGMYMNGVNGAYNFGIKHTNSDFIFRMDSDNFLCGPNFFSKIIKPMLEDHSIHLSVSVEVLSPGASCYDHYSLQKGIKMLFKNISGGKINDEYYVVDDLSYGLTNCVLFRRNVYEQVGAFVSDISFLRALRTKKLSKAAIVIDANFTSLLLGSYSSLLKKMYKRHKIVYLNLGDYNLMNLPSGEEYEEDQLSLISYVKNLFLTLYNFVKSRDRVYFCGLLLETMPLMLLLIRPLSSILIYFRYIWKLGH